MAVSEDMLDKSRQYPGLDEIDDPPLMTLDYLLGSPLQRHGTEKSMSGVPYDQVAKVDGKRLKRPRRTIPLLKSLVKSLEGYRDLRKALEAADEHHREILNPYCRALELCLDLEEVDCKENQRLVDYLRRILEKWPAEPEPPLH
jgi:hypothetical protein